MSLFIYRASNINKTSPMIVNIVENQILVYYNAEKLPQYSGSISEPYSLRVVRSKQVDS